jgi:hypothetical protein
MTDDAHRSEPIPAEQLGELRKRIDALDEGLVHDLNKVVSMLNEVTGSRRGSPGPGGGTEQRPIA